MFSLVIKSLDLATAPGLALGLATTHIPPPSAPVEMIQTLSTKVVQRAGYYPQVYSQL